MERCQGHYTNFLNKSHTIFRQWILCGQVVDTQPSRVPLICFNLFMVFPRRHFSSLPNLKSPIQKNNRNQTSCSMHSNFHYTDVIMGPIASQITSLTIVYSTVIQTQIKENIKFPRGPVNSPHKGPPVTRKMFLFDDVIMLCRQNSCHRKGYILQHHCASVWSEYTGAFWLLMILNMFSQIKQHYLKRSIQSFSRYIKYHLFPLKRKWVHVIFSR